MTHKMNTNFLTACNNSIVDNSIVGNSIVDNSIVDNSIVENLVVKKITETNLVAITMIENKCEHVFVPDRTYFDPCKTVFVCKLCGTND